MRASSHIPSTSCGIHPTRVSQRISTRNRGRSCITQHTAYKPCLFSSKRLSHSVFEKTDDPRLEDVISKDATNSNVTIVGFPYDIGVERNGGRVGAKHAPSAFRKLVKRVGPVVNAELGVDLRRIRIGDAGDVPDNLTLEDAHTQLRQKVGQVLSNGSLYCKRCHGANFGIGGYGYGGSGGALSSHKYNTNVHDAPSGPAPVQSHLPSSGGGGGSKFCASCGSVAFVIGGGNDQSYPNAAALLDNSKGLSIGVVNIDAHLDVRPLKEGKVHSGSPFRLLLEDGRFSGRNFREFGCQGNQCTVEHVKYIQSKGGELSWLSSLRSHDVSIGSRFASLLQNDFGSNNNNVDKIFVSFDLDSVQASDAPGVSAVGVVGLSSQDALDICLEAGKNPKVQLFDLSEFNPTIEEWRTGKLVANMFYYFCLGVAQRPQFNK